MVIFIAKLFYIQKLAAVPCAYCNKSPLEYQAPALAGAQATGQGKDHVVGVVLLCLLVDTCCGIIPHGLMLTHQTRPTPKSYPETACSGWGNEENLLRWRGDLGHGGFGPSSPQQTTLDARRGEEMALWQGTASPWSCRTPQRLAEIQAGHKLLLQSA